MLRDVSEYTLEIQPLTALQQIAGEKSGVMEVTSKRLATTHAA